jgi:hypothetical protein
LPLPSQRFPAVWWADVPATQAQRWYGDALNARQYYKPLRNGEKGCYASHIGAWQQLLASDAPALVVLEDDVRLTPQFAEVIEAIAALTEPWDMVLCGLDGLAGSVGRANALSLSALHAFASEQQPALFDAACAEGLLQCLNAYASGGFSAFITQARSRTTASGRRLPTLRRADGLPMRGRNADGRR